MRRLVFEVAAKTVYEYETIYCVICALCFVCLYHCMLTNPKFMAALSQ